MHQLTPIFFTSPTTPFTHTLVPRYFNIHSHSLMKLQNHFVPLCKHFHACISLASYTFTSLHCIPHFMHFLYVTLLRQVAILRERLLWTGILSRAHLGGITLKDHTKFWFSILFMRTGGSISQCHGVLILPKSACFSHLWPILLVPNYESPTLGTLYSYFINS